MLYDDEVIDLYDLGRPTLGQKCGDLLQLSLAMLGQVDGEVYGVAEYSHQVGKLADFVHPWRLNL